MAGDLRLFYPLWLTAVEADVFEADEPEPMPGIEPITVALEAFATFFGIDADLVRAAAEQAATPLPAAADSGVVKACLWSRPDGGFRKPPEGDPSEARAQGGVHRTDHEDRLTGDDSPKACPPKPAGRSRMAVRSVQRELVSVKAH